MVDIYKIPFIQKKPQTVSVRFTPESFITLRFFFVNADEGGWCVDISDGRTGSPLICGIPLLTKQDLLEQYEYIDLPIVLFVRNLEEPEEPPTWESMGVNSNIYYYVKE